MPYALPSYTYYFTQFYILPSMFFYMNGNLNMHTIVISKLRYIYICLYCIFKYKYTCNTCCVMQYTCNTHAIHLLHACMLSLLCEERRKEYNYGVCIMLNSDRRFTFTIRPLRALKIFKWVSSLCK
jgi:hypothetical protein